MSDLIGPIIKSKVFQNASFAVGILCFILAALLLLWLWRDARRRGATGAVWTVIGVAVALVAALVGLSLSEYGFGPVGILAILALLVVIMVYSFVRPSDFIADAREQALSLQLLEAQIERETCPTCGHGVETKFLICPYCNTTLRVACDFCGQPIQPDWAVCPYCKANQRQHAQDSALFIAPPPSYDAYDTFEDDEVDIKPPRPARAPGAPKSKPKSSKSPARKSTRTRSAR